jgi:thiol-disulfide isomerase/thioredoxin
MKKIILFIIALLGTIAIHAQDVNWTDIDSVSQKEILIGKCTYDGLLKNAVFAEACKTEFKYYKVDSASVNAIGEKMDNISMLIFLGTWCGDSKEQVPRFFKILGMLNYDAKSIKYYCNKRGKYSDDPYSNQFNILKIPTFIFIKDGVEIGRIVETPKVSLEKDMLEIVGKGK